MQQTSNGYIVSIHSSWQKKGVKTFSDVLQACQKYRILFSKILLWCLPAIHGRNWQSQSVSVSLSLEIQRRVRSNDFQRKLLQISSSSPSVVPPEIVFLGGSISPEVLSANFCRGLPLKHWYTRPYNGWKATFCFEIFVWSVHQSPAEDHGEVPTWTTEKSRGRDSPS